MENITSCAYSCNDIYYGLLMFPKNFKSFLPVDFYIYPMVKNKSYLKLLGNHFGESNLLEGKLYCISGLN